MAEVVVTQADREAAGEIYRRFGFNGGPGLDVSNSVVQIVTRHRLAAVAAERESCAELADKWAQENREACSRARRRERRMEDLGLDTPEMADALDVSAIECNAIAAAIRARTEQPE